MTTTSTATVTVRSSSLAKAKVFEGQTGALVVNVRNLVPNPRYNGATDGRDEATIEATLDTENAFATMKAAADAVRKGGVTNVVFADVSGEIRSVACAEALARKLDQEGYSVKLLHEMLPTESEDAGESGPKDRWSF